MSSHGCIPSAPIYHLPNALYRDDGAPRFEREYSMAAGVFRRLEYFAIWSISRFDSLGHL
jgi:hypothetical protein